MTKRLRDLTPAEAWTALEDMPPPPDERRARSVFDKLWRVAFGDGATIRPDPDPEEPTGTVEETPDAP